MAFTSLPIATADSALTGTQGVAAIQKAHDMPSAAELNLLNPTSRAMKLALKNARLPIPISIQGDSTANEDTEWFILAMAEMAAKYPAYNMIQYLWSDANQTFLPPTTKQIGTSGERYVYLDESLDMSGVVLDSSNNLDLTSDLDVRIKFNLDSYTDDGENILIGKFGAPGNRSWALRLSTSGFPTLWFSNDGSALTLKQGSVAIPAAGNDVYLRCTMDVDDGAGSYLIVFYTSSDDGVTWNQLGGNLNGTATALFNSTADVTINGRGTAQWNGKFYHAELLNGIDGPMIASPNAALYMQTEEYKNFKDTQGNSCSFNAATGDSAGSPTIVLINASAPGKALGYSLNATRFAKQTPIRCLLNFISYSHNDGGTSDYYNNYPLLIAQILTAYKNAVVVPCTQNPKKSPSGADSILEHGYRCGIIAQIAASKSLTLVDAYGVFLDTGVPNDYVDSDGVHPTKIPENGTAISGSQLWANAALGSLGL
jgi:hypothetical protein